MKTRIRQIQIISIVIVLISLIGINFTYALYADNTEGLNNTFIKIKDTNVEVTETFDGLTKEDVSFVIDSDVPINLRAKLIINFVDEDGSILPDTPIRDIDYTMIINSAWSYKDGYYYLNETQRSGETPVLIEKMYSLIDSKKLSVEILVQTI